MVPTLSPATSIPSPVLYVLLVCVHTCRQGHMQYVYARMWRPEVDVLGLLLLFTFLLFFQKSLSLNSELPSGLYW